MVEVELGVLFANLLETGVDRGDFFDPASDFNFAQLRMLEKVSSRYSICRL